MTEVKPAGVIENAIMEAGDRRSMRAGMDMMMERAGEMGSVYAAQLAGLYLEPSARRMTDEMITDYWKLRSSPVDYSQEVIIGAGIHAAIIAAIRVRLGFGRPLVLDMAPADRAGCAYSFGVSDRPVFWLNSRERRGEIGPPDQGEALNGIPGAVVQPNMLTCTEYPSNDVMRWLVRVTLAQFARVIPDSRVVEIQNGADGPAALKLEDGRMVLAGRVYDARGVGLPVRLPAGNGTTVLSFDQAMARAGRPFPWRGIRRVALIGGGDSAKVVAESMLGIGPPNGMSPAGLDQVERIDWYVAGGRISDSCARFREVSRGRYIRLAQFLPGNESQPANRLQVISRIAGEPAPYQDRVLLEGRTYDLVVYCTGYLREVLYEGASRPRSANLAQQTGKIFSVGPAANLPLSIEELKMFADNTANKVAMFRLAPRTAALAASLPK